MKAIGKTVAHRRMSGIGTYSFRFKSPYWIYRISRIYCLPKPTAIYYADHHRRQAQCCWLVVGYYSTVTRNGWRWLSAITEEQRSP